MSLKADPQNSLQSGPIAVLSLGASIVQKSIERRFSRSGENLKSRSGDVAEFAEPRDSETEGDRTPCFDLADDLEAGFMAEAFMAKDTTKPVQQKAPLRRCCIFHADSGNEYHLISESGDHMLTAKYIRTTARVEFFLLEGESKTPRKQDCQMFSKRRPAFVMIHDVDRSTWLLKQTDCEYCMHRPKHLSCESLGQGQQVAFLQHSLRSVGQAKVNYVDIRIPPLACETESSVWCTVAMGRGLCSQSYSGVLRRSGQRRTCALNTRSDSETGSLDKDGSMTPPRSPTAYCFDVEGQPVRLHTKVPVWSEELESLVLSFNDRTVKTSPMNFMLQAEDNDSIIMQHAMIAANTFALDYRYPLSTIQAFAIALTALTWE